MDTQEKILIAAAEEFALNGFNGTTMRGISKRAGINHAGINYHFNSKKDLYKEVFAYLHEKTLSKITKYRDDISSAEEWQEAIFQLVMNILKNMTEPDDLSRWKDAIIFREMVEPSESLDLFYDKYIKFAIRDINNYIRIGLSEPCDEKEVVFYTFSLLSQCVFYEQNRAFVEKAGGKDFFSNKNLEKIAKYTTENVCRKLKFNRSHCKTDTYKAIEK